MIFLLYDPYAIALLQSTAAIQYPDPPTRRRTVAERNSHSRLKFLSRFLPLRGGRPFYTHQPPGSLW